MHVGGMHRPVQTAGHGCCRRSGRRGGEHPRLGVTGACVFGAAWIGTMVAAGATAEDGHKRGAVGHAAVPVVGPVLMSSEGTAPADIEGVLIGLMALQGAGLVTAFVGLTADSLVLEPRADGEAALLSVSPVVGPTGVGVVGRF